MAAQKIASGIGGYDRIERENPHNFTDSQIAEREKWVDETLRARPHIFGGAYYLSLVWDMCQTMSEDEHEQMKERILASKKSC